MPHFIVDYTANLESELELDVLFGKVHRQLIDMQLFPTGGIRSRARRIEHYCFADGLGDYAGIHVVLKLNAARPKALREEIGKNIFATLQAHFADLQARRYLALSMEVGLFHPETFFNSNNLHALFGNPSK
ncbi:5-carboxymethyl-2-hydroxymuconate Delta-isomerase [Pseudomonas fluorescens]|uniref:5-carboxymethyl-2-hydroxymuconate Delta-isomerase n=1 Tax=Pseudomonas fluorescens TaxID=294 RepID=A0A5E6U0G3_PSEFL|nr:5-carboxymethyl-2-hydroxymuconate isomerase [Pseudomonas fluorescens]VVM98332.1 5-carboxymethyl-2-hydroxymuconate Delta-isomerase [Pseudomonas fluorescens]